jgi:hypothetical protein
MMNPMVSRAYSNCSYQSQLLFKAISVFFFAEAMWLRAAGEVSTIRRKLVVDDQP